MIDTEFELEKEKHAEKMVRVDGGLLLFGEVENVSIHVGSNASVESEPYTGGFTYAQVYKLRKDFDAKFITKPNPVFTWESWGPLV